MNRRALAVILGLGMSALLSGCLLWGPPETKYDGKIMRASVYKIYSRAEMAKGWDNYAEKDLKELGIKITKDEFLDRHVQAALLIHRRFFDGVMAGAAYIPQGMNVEPEDIVDFIPMPRPQSNNPEASKILRIVCKHNDQACIAKKGNRGIVLQPDNPDSPIDTL